MHHDVYSLGVCLLEIGLWTSFVKYGIGANGEDLILPGLIEIASVPQSRDQRKRAFDLKQILTNLAKEKLPCHIGERYTTVVVSCLTCLDKDSEFGNTGILDSDDGVALGVQFIEKVCVSRYHNLRRTAY